MVLAVLSLITSTVAARGDSSLLCRCFREMSVGLAETMQAKSKFQQR